MVFILIVRGEFSNILNGGFSTTDHSEPFGLIFDMPLTRADIKAAGNKIQCNVR